MKVKQSITPYVRFIRNGLEQNVETVYLVGNAENEKAIKEVCVELSDIFDTVSEKKMDKLVVFEREKRKLKTFLVVLRAKNLQLYTLADVEPYGRRQS
jgi:ribonucleotide monophosphatase NagD (HAD superfamily)